MGISESGNIYLNNGLKVFAVANGMLLSTIVRAILTTAEVTLKIANKKTVMWVKATLVFKSVTGIIDG